MKCNECGKKLESKKLIKKSERFCDGICQVKSGAVKSRSTPDGVEDLIRQEPRQS